jgi:hypothetical protein
MKKVIIPALLCLALNAGAAPQLEDFTILINVRSCERVQVAGAPTPRQSPTVYTGPVTYQQPAVYNAPVVYQGPVFYNGPVTYNTTTTLINANSGGDTLINCGGGSDSSLSYGYSAYSNPNLIRFGHLQAIRQGYHFNHR